MVHAGLSIGFALAHVGLYQAFGLESNLVGWGVLFGAIHWLIVGMGMGMRMMRIMHQGIKTGIISAPGAFALGYPKMTAAGFLILHVVYWVLVAAMYEGIA